MEAIIASMMDLTVCPSKIDYTDYQEDHVMKAFQTDGEFQMLLKNGTFHDYFNTFLSLPVFAKRLMFRKDTGTFEIEPPIRRTTHHLMNENVLHWTRVTRGPIFLKTSICNEYRLSRVLLQLPISLDFEPFSEKEIIKFHQRYLSKVIDIQRLKYYLHKSIGENLIQFWLEAERFRRQVHKDCRRFVLKEIQEKFLNAGSVMEVSISIRDDITSYIKREKMVRKSTDSFATILVEPQSMVLHCLQDYWIPKYILHRIKKRATMLSKWGTSIKLTRSQIRAGKSGTQQIVESLNQNMYDVYLQMKDQINQIEELDEKNKSKNQIEHLFVPSEKVGSQRRLPKSLPNLLKKAVAHVDNEKSKSNHTMESTGDGFEETDISSSEEEALSKVIACEKTRRIAERIKRGKKQKDIEHCIEELKIIDPMRKKRKAEERKRKRAKNKRGSPSSASDRSTPVFRASPDDGRLSLQSAHSFPTPRKMFGMFVNVMGTATKEEEDNLGKYKKEITVYDDNPPEVPKEKVVEVGLPQINRQQFAQENPSKGTRTKATLYEALYQEKENKPYDADNEEELYMRSNVSRLTPYRQELQSKDKLLESPEDSFNELHLPLIYTLEQNNKSFMAMLTASPAAPSQLKLHYAPSCMRNNRLAIAEDFTTTKQFNLLMAALTTDAFAGQPLLEYFTISENKFASDNLKFWSAGHKILSNINCDQPRLRMKQYSVFIELYLNPERENLVVLPPVSKLELMELLRKDMGLTRLMEACDIVAQTLLPFWEEYLFKDEQKFLDETTKNKRDFNGIRRETAVMGLEYNGQLETTDGQNPDNEHMRLTRRWRAMELAMSICLPTSDFFNNEDYNWSDDEEDEEDSDEDDDSFGSLGVNRHIQIMSRRIVQRRETRDSIFNRVGLFHDYSGTSGLLSKIPETDPAEFLYNIAIQEEQNRKKLQLKPPRPRNFMEVLTDPVQLDFFRKYLTKGKAETPLLFWVAVESMRTTSKRAKARQGRAHGIVKRYFGPAANFGKDLRCNADIIREIACMEKISPAMLVSAQTCVAKSIEDEWFEAYLRTFQDDGGTTGVTLLPIYGVNEATAYRTVKQKSRGLWRMFTRNVISFRRGVMDKDTCRLFTNFLMIQHELVLAEQNESPRYSVVDNNGNPIQNGTARTVVSNKVIQTDKLVADLHFWTEVERYKDLADAVVYCARLGNYNKDDEIIVVKKACTIVECFLDSQIIPRIQINISPDLADNIVHLVQDGIIERGLFHEAAVSVFTVLLFYWKKFCMHRMIPKEQLPISLSQIIIANKNKRGSLKINRSAYIEQKLTSIKRHKMKRVSLPPEEDHPKIMFSLQHGIRCAFSKSKRREKSVASPLNLLAQHANTLLQENKFKKNERKGLGAITENAGSTPLNTTRDSGDKKRNDSQGYGDAFRGSIKLQHIISNNSNF